MAAFETGRMPARQWNYRTRLFLGLWHVLSRSPDEALEALRRGLTACEAAQHGTQPRPADEPAPLTACELARIKEFAISAPPNPGLLELANACSAPS